MTSRPVPSAGNPATFLKPGEPVLERAWKQKRVRIFMPEGPKLYLRLRPENVDGSLSPEGIISAALNAGLEPMRRSAGALGYSTEPNDYGAVVFHCSAELECLCLSQLHWNYEIWGIDARHAATGNGGDEEHGRRRSTKPIREVFTYTLENFLDAARRLNLKPPFRLECGLIGSDARASLRRDPASAKAVETQNLVWNTRIIARDGDAASCLKSFFERLRQ